VKTAVLDEKAPQTYLLTYTLGDGTRLTRRLTVWQACPALGRPLRPLHWWPRRPVGAPRLPRRGAPRCDVLDLYAWTVATQDVRSLSDDQVRRVLDRQDALHLAGCGMLIVAHGAPIAWGMTQIEDGWAGPDSTDLTRRHKGAPLGERMILAGRVLDEDGRPVARHGPDGGALSSETEFETGRPPGVPRGFPLDMALTFAIAPGLPLPCPG